MILVILSCAWVGGIVLGSLFNLPYFLIFTGLVPLPLLFFLRKRTKLLILISLSIIAFCGGSICYTASLPPDNSSQLRFYNGSTVAITGMISRDSDVRDTGIQLEFTATAINRDAKQESIHGKVLIFVASNNDYRYGDIVHLSGNLETPPVIGDFDYRNYLANQGIDSVMYRPEVEIIDRGKGNTVMTWIYSLRNSMAGSLSRILPEPQASLAQGILLGLRGNIPQDLKDDFAQSGTTHILAISGQNLSIVAGILISLGIWLFGRRHYIYIWLALAVILIYTLMTGVSLPVVRAAIMTGLFLFAELAGRQRSAATALAFAAAVMIGITPSVLWDASFQLSFLAMAGLVIIAPGLQNISRKTVTSILGESGIQVSLTNIVLDSFCVTLAALLAVWPVIAYYFGIISLVAPLSSLLAIPSMTGIIVTSALAGGFGIILLPLGQVLGWVTWLFLSYLLLIVKAFAAIPASFITAPFISPVFLGIYYSCLILAIWVTVNRRRLWTVLVKWFKSARQIFPHLNMKWIVTPLMISASLVTIIAITLPDNMLHVEFLDIGQGDAILITQGKQQVLVDGGPSPQSIATELGAHMPFWDRNIELVILTHPDSDHLAGLVTVLQRYRVEQVICPEFDADSDLYTQWQKLLSDHDVKITTAREGQTITLGNGVEINILSPQIPPAFPDDSDDNGVVLRLSDGKTSFLLTGDITAQGEFALISGRADLESTILKVAHHGSANSTTTEFLNVVGPQAAVISVGEDNPYGHPSPATMDRLKAEINSTNIYRTDEDGTVEFITNGERLWVKTEK